MGSPGNAFRTLSKSQTSNDHPSICVLQSHSASLTFQGRSRAWGNLTMIMHVLLAILVVLVMIGLLVYFSDKG
jgi:hypothetical protein